MPLTLNLKMKIDSDVAAGPVHESPSKRRLWSRAPAYWALSLAWPLYCAEALILNALVFFYRAVDFLRRDPLRLSRFIFSYCSRPRYHRSAALRLLPVYWLASPRCSDWRAFEFNATSSVPTASAPSGAVACVSVLNLPIGRPSLKQRWPRNFGVTAPTASPPEAQRTRLEDAGDTHAMGGG
jgi:hypothetical protein